MGNNVVDARGLVCPRPLIMTKKALNDSAVSARFEILLDNETAIGNVQRFLRDNGVRFSGRNAGGHYIVEVDTDGQPVETPVEEYCELPALETASAPESGHVICVRSHHIGTVDNELSRDLIREFVCTIGEISPLPRKMVFYGSGVALLARGSGADEALIALEAKGVELLACGRCVDALELKGNMAAGTISNMYDILNILTMAPKVITP